MSLSDSARTLLGAPFHHQGRGPAAYDCVGLVIAAAAREGLELPDVFGYGRMGNLEVARAALASCTEVLDGPEEDVIAFLKLRNRAHLGIVGTRDGVFTVIHAWQPSKRVVEEPIRLRRRLNWTYHTPWLQQS